MFIQNNNIANQLYVPYQQNINAVSQSARRLATGEKIPNSADGPGELGVAERWKNHMLGTEKLISGIVAAQTYGAAIDESVSQGVEILNRMVELASSALDVTKNTADRIALDTEFAALVTEFSHIQHRTYNGISVFATSLSVRVGLEVGELVILSTIQMFDITFDAFTLSQLASASAALISLKSRVTSINLFKARVGEFVNELQRAVDYSRVHVNELGRAENEMRNIDVAKEAGTFTQRQVMLAASQSILAQSNGIVQSALQFLG